MRSPSMDACVPPWRSLDTPATKNGEICRPKRLAQSSLFGCAAEELSDQVKKRRHQLLEFSWLLPGYKST